MGMIRGASYGQIVLGSPHIQNGVPMKAGLTMLGIALFAIFFLGLYDRTSRLPRQEARNALIEMLVEGQRNSEFAFDLMLTSDTCRFGIADSLALDSLFKSTIKLLSSSLREVKAGISSAEAKELTASVAVREAWEHQWNARQYNERAWRVCLEIQERLDAYRASPH